MDFKGHKNRVLEMGYTIFSHAFKILIRKLQLPVQCHYALVAI